MKLGPLQKIWIKSLRDNPEKQEGGSLAIFKDKDDIFNYKACCLGEYLLCKLRMDNLDIKKRLTARFSPEVGFSLRDIKDFNEVDNKYCNIGSTGTLTNYKSLKLRSIVGYVDQSKVKGDNPFLKVACSYSLAELNDNGISWPEIADFIENNPEAVFTGSL